MRSNHLLAATCAATFVIAVTACGRASDEQARAARPANAELASFPAEWTYQPGAAAPTAPDDMVVSNCPLATKAGVEILNAGGNAVDAAVAVGFALAVAYPEAGNLGGGGYAVVRLADGTSAALDYREMAPAAASRDMYLGPDGQPTDASLVGYRASGVPGSVAGLLALLEKHGTLDRQKVMAPAIRLAKDGFDVDAAFRRSLERNAKLIEQFDGASLFLPSGAPPAVGTRFVQPDLARTLQRIADQGADGFYKGPVAAAVDQEMKRHGGTITAADMAAYKPEWRTPIESSYRGHGLVAMPPSSSGGVTVAESLNILETWPQPAPWGSAEALHRLASAFQLAFIDRNKDLGGSGVRHRSGRPADQQGLRAHAARAHRRRPGDADGDPGGAAARGPPDDQLRGRRREGQRRRDHDDHQQPVRVRRVGARRGVLPQQ